MINHFFPGFTGQGVVFLKEDSLFRADFLAKSTEDTAEHVDFEISWLLLDVARGFIHFWPGRRDLNCLWRANELTKLARDTLGSVFLVFDQVRRSSVTFRDNPALFWVLHRDLLLEEVTQSDSEATNNRGKIEAFPPSKIFSLNDHLFASLSSEKQ